MTIYEKPVYALLKDMLEDMRLDVSSSFTQQDAVEWFRRNYPLINASTVQCHLIRLSVNAPSRIHYNAVRIRDDLLYKIDAHTYRLYQPGKDTEPIWPSQSLESFDRPKKRENNKYAPKIQEILDNLDRLHDSFYKNQVFTGPSLYFHRKTLESISNASKELYIERIYATLVAWGMHRMGENGAKMQGFKIFYKSIENLWPKIQTARGIDIYNMHESDWRLLKTIFENIDIMASGSSLVGNSKVMAHLLPEVIPPIDRSYTLKFLQGHTNINNGLTREWQFMRRLLTDFFIPITKNTTFREKTVQWLTNQSQYPWDTSCLKIIDNLIIAAVKAKSIHSRTGRVTPGS